MSLLLYTRPMALKFATRRGVSLTLSCLTFGVISVSSRPTHADEPENDMGHSSTTPLIYSLVTIPSPSPSFFSTSSNTGSSSGPPPTKNNNNNNNNDNDPVAQLIDQYGPLLSQVGFGSIVGYTSGYAAKKIGQGVAFIFGCAFITTQMAAYTGYIDIKWKRVVDDAKLVLDADGDGELTKDDLMIYWKRFKSMMSFNLPGGGGFGVGFLYGLAA